MRNWRQLYKRVRSLPKKTKILAVSIIFIITIFLLYQFNWTGFGEDKILSIDKNAKGEVQRTRETIQSAKTLWDWLELSGVLAIPVLLAILGYQFQRREQERAIENLRDEALLAYLDSMSTLLLEHNLKTEPVNSPVHDVARARTLTLLRKLDKDGERKETVIRFLIDAELIGDTGLNLSTANLSNVILEDASLNYIKLIEADLSYAILSGAKLKNAKLSKANLNNAILSKADLSDADLSDADLSNADLTDTILTGTILRGAVLPDGIHQP